MDTVTVFGRTMYFVCWQPEQVDGGERLAICAGSPRDAYTAAGDVRREGTVDAITVPVELVSTRRDLRPLA